MSVIEDNWNYFIDLTCLQNTFFLDFESKINSSLHNINMQLENSCVTQTYNFTSSTTAHQDDELKMMIEKNKELRSSIDQKLEAISQQQAQYETYKKDQRLLSQEIKETHEAFLMAKKYYKKFLKIYYTVECRAGENQIIFVQFFTETKKDSENYSVRLQRNTKTGLYQLTSTTPKLPSTKNLQRWLQETNDVPGALCSIRQAFINMKTNKK